MEPLDFDQKREESLNSNIRTILLLEDRLIGLLEQAAREALSTPNSDETWFKEAAAKIREYRTELERAALNHDAYLVSNWAGAVSGGAMTRYFDYAPSRYSQQNAVEELLDKLSEPSRLVAFQLIRRSDPASLDAAKKALQGFGP